MKRIFYLLTIIGVVALVAGIFYFLRYRSEVPEAAAPIAPGGLPQAPQTIPASPAQEPSGEIIQPGEQKFGVIAKNEVLSYFVDGQNNAVIVQPDGQVIKIARGEASVLSSSAISNLMEAEFSYDGKYILAAFGLRSSPEYSVFNVETKSWRPLLSGIKSAAWSPSDRRIAYLRESNGIKILETSDVAGTKAVPQELLRFRAEDLVLSWVGDNQIVLGEKSSAFLAGSIWSFNIQNKRLSQLVHEKLGLDYQWSGRAGMGLVFAADASRRGGQLSLYDTTGNTVANLSFLTLPSKCAFDAVAGKGTSTAASKFLYCAIPVNSETLTTAFLPDDYQKMAVFTRDGFYKINIADGSIGEVLGERLVDGDKLKVFGKNLFFVNRLDKKLYAISLAE